MPVSAPALTAPAPPAGKSELLWYKDALVYQLHVRAFADSNGDGVGDFPGLTERLDYIQDLGVTAIWLLPFFRSPLRDDGYDIADYQDINPIYGTLHDFKRLLHEAHRRGLRVITELVMNHTSDQHDWFQRSRRAKPGSKWRDFYVWSDTPEKYADARVIFQDFERSNWTWDPVAGAYFWHRFYHHQPDLNFDSPEVRRAMIRMVDYWLELGVDGLRLDAVPYLFEREGTNCENLPETHAFLRDLRRHIDDKFRDRMLLAEANQWPEDAAAYFGNGDECHMNFHFPLMPRLFMAVQREDRFPIIDILEQTPSLPENCQWAIFLRNHDELTLEMVTDEERDYMYRAYATDPQARVNLGIRRRLAPLMQNNRRKIELMNGLLLSLPGTPIIYYGDEIGMGDNIYLGDRNGVRTPMQWNGDRNAGFSRANPQKLFLPTIIDPEYHYTLCNVEVEHNSPHSLLWWMRRIIGMRKRMRVFGHGSFEILTPEGAKVLAFLRQYEDETLLVVANLSRYTQSAELDLSRFRGWVPIELFGRTRFPAIGELPYFLTLGPHTFYWFQIEHREQEPALRQSPELPSCRTRGGWENVFESPCGKALQDALAPYLRRHRWFGGKGRMVQSTEVLDQFALPPYVPEGRGTDGSSRRQAQKPAEGTFIYLLLTRVHYTDGEPETYLLPVVFADEAQARNIIGDRPAAGILKVELADQDQARTLCEATWETDLWLPVLDTIARRRTIRGRRGEITVLWTKAFRRLWNAGGDLQPVHVHGGEQSNTSAVFGNRFMLKLFRRLSPGTNPDLEIGQFLTENVPDAPAPDVAGALEYRSGTGDTLTLAILHEYVSNEGDAWVFTLDELERYLERIQSVSHDVSAHASYAVAPSPGAPRDADAEAGRQWSTEFLPEPREEKPSIRDVLRASEGSSFRDMYRGEPPRLAEEMFGAYLQSAELLGRRSAELHVGLASRCDDPAFAPEPFTQLYQRSLYQSMRMQARRNLALLRRQRPNLPEEASSLAERVLNAEGRILDRLRQLLDHKITAQRFRCHGDFHMGQVLYTGKDFVIIDFEGEPERPISERRIKASPLRDVAGMIRSFHYASHAALMGSAPGIFAHREASISPGEWMQFWYVWSTASFLRAYLAKAELGNFLPASDEELAKLLDAYVMEKSLYELGYELNNRPNWVTIPLEGVLQLLQ